MMNPNEILQKAKDALDEALKQKRSNQEFMRSLGPAIVDTLKPVLDEIAHNSKIPKEEVLKAISNIKIPQINVPRPEVHVAVPDIKIPEIRVPKSEVHFDLSKIKIPDVKMPDEMNIKGWVNFMGFDKSFYKNPLPVQLMDAQGNPLKIFENLTQVMQGGGGGGKHDFFTIKGFSQSAFAEVMNPDGRLKVELPSGASGLTDTELRATAVPVSQVSGANWSVNVVGFSASVAANLSDSSGVGYSGSNPLPITVVSGALTSTISVGPTVADAADDGSAPIQGGGIARTTNPTAVADNDVVKSSHDSVGRQLIRPVQVRGLMATAYISLANGTETTLLANGGAGVFHDLVFISATNNSTVAVQVDIRDATAGGVVQTLLIPASTGPVGFALPVPWPQGNANNNWTADMGDITGTTVYLSALFSKEV